MLELRKTLSKLNISPSSEVIVKGRRSVVVVCLLFVSLAIVNLASVFPVFSRVYLSFIFYQDATSKKEFLLSGMRTTAFAFNILVISPTVLFYGMLYIAFSVVCCTYIQGFNSSLQKLKTSSEAGQDIWDFLHQQRADLTSAVSSLDNLISPIFFLCILWSASHIPVALFGLFRYFCSTINILSVAVNIVNNTLFLFLLSLFASNVHEEGLNCTSSLVGLTSKQHRQQAFYLKYDLNTNPLQLTAWKFFVITKGTVLTIVGSIVTYSVVVYQMTDFAQRNEFCAL